MCTAFTYTTRHFYLGRTLDYDCAYTEEITVTPRGYLDNRYAMIGMAYVVDDYPLYYDAANEAGLCMAGLNFVDSAHYQSGQGVAPHAFIPYLLGQCATVAQAKTLLSRTRLVSQGFGQLPIARLHWLIADRRGSITVEPTVQGLMIYDNPVGVLANEPPFPAQLARLGDYRHLSSQTPPNTFGSNLPAISRGLGSIGLPGDYTSSARFVRAAFVRNHAVGFRSEAESVNQCFHILDSIAIPRGVCDIGEGHYHHTLYTACLNVSRGVYYYNTYDNRRITAVTMHHADRQAPQLLRYPLLTSPSFACQNTASVL